MKSFQPSWCKTIFGSCLVSLVAAGIWYKAIALIDGRETPYERGGEWIEPFFILLLAVVPLAAAVWLAIESRGLQSALGRKIDHESEQPYHIVLSLISIIMAAGMMLMAYGQSLAIERMGAQ